MKLWVGMLAALTLLVSGAARGEWIVKVLNKATKEEKIYAPGNTAEFDVPWVTGSRWTCVIGFDKRTAKSATINCMVVDRYTAWTIATQQKPGLLVLKDDEIGPEFWITVYWR